MNDDAIIFDMDGTLFQTHLILERALEATFEQLREKGQWIGETPLKAYREIMGVSLPVVWKTLCPEHTIDMHVESNRNFQTVLIEHIKKGHGALYDGVEATLEKLSQQYDLYIASNGQTDYLNAIVETYELTRWIKGVYSIDRVFSGHKSELVAMVLHENKLQHGYVIGDRLSDIQAALDNDLVSIGVRFHFSKEEELEKAMYTVNQFEEISLILDKRKLNAAPQPRLPSIYTKRLILRKVDNQDAEALYAYFSNEEVTKYYGMSTFNHIEQAKQLIAQFHTNIAQSTGTRWAITLKNTSEVIGTIGFNLWSQAHKRANIGYELHPSYWGSGYIKEALENVIEYGFAHMDLSRIGAIVFIKNMASIKALEQAGFEKEGLLRHYMYQAGVPHDVFVYGLLNNKTNKKYEGSM